MSSLFTIIPLASAICNLFLLLTMLSAKRSRAIRSFILLTAAFTVWTLASFFMRLSFLPGAAFWFHVSMGAIFFVPPLIYYFLISYVGEKSTILLPICLGGTVVMVVLDCLELFIQNPMVVVNNGVPAFTYTVGTLSVIPVIFAAFELFLALQVVLRSIKGGQIHTGSFTPLFTGVGIMFLAMLLDLVPGLSSQIPLDPLACMVNAIFLYTMLYQKRLFTLVQLASSASTYLISAAMAAAVVVVGYSGFDQLYAQLGWAEANKPVTAALISLLVALITIALVRFLVGRLFISRHAQREARLKDFSLAISQSLDREKTLAEYMNFVSDYSGSPKIYVFTKSGDSYIPAACSDALTQGPLSFRAESPIITFLQREAQATTADVLLRSPEWRAAWESESRALEDMDTELILPVMAENEMPAIALLAAREGRSGYAFEELNFLDSASSITGMAMKNVLLYEQIWEESHKDHMTDLWNRAYFTELLDKELEKKAPLTLALLKMDDFKLYNELYGSEAGDLALRAFADVLRDVVGNAGILSCSGKDYYIAFPALNPTAVKGILMICRDKFQKDDGSRCKITFSAGLCSYPDRGLSRKELMTFANMAVEQAKRSGKDQVVIYGEDIEEEVHNRVEQLGKEYAPTIYALTAAIDAKDHYTFTHCENVTNLATQLAKAAGFTAEHVEMIRQAGLLHDVGKISIPESVLAKPGRLTDEEYGIMKSHVDRSIEIIRHLPSLNYVVPIVVGHHERWDGRGYPRGLAGADIPLGARCVSLADSFDAIASKRVYKAAVPVDKAIDEIERCLGSQFDPELGALFVKMLRSGEIDTTVYRKKAEEVAAALAAEAAAAAEVETETPKTES